MTQEVQPNLIVRASSVPEAFDCAARFKVKSEGLFMPSTAPAIIGSAVHAGTALFDTERVAGQVPSLIAAMDAAREFIEKPKEDVLWDDFRPKDAKDIAGILTAKYCENVAPKYTYDAVETKMVSTDITAYNGVIIRFTGTIDRRYVVWEPTEDPKVMRETKGIADIKTGRNIVDKNGVVKTQISAAQFGTYEILELMATKSFGEPTLADALVLGFSTAKGYRTAAATVKTPRGLMIGDKDHRGLIDELARNVKDDSWPGNPKSIMCNPKYCPIYNNCFYRR